jgi:hypothetical protein
MKSLKTETNDIAQDIRVNTPGKNLAGKPILSLILLLKLWALILG